jgi:NNP family nitrate/nitrite transporter-like MFS transporter
MSHPKHWSLGAKDLTGIRSSAFMLIYGVLWVSLISMYWTEVRGAELMETKAKPFRLRG